MYKILCAVLLIIALTCNSAAIAQPVKLAYGTAPQQYGELWLPESKGPFPVAIMIHGGCWQALLPSIGLMDAIAEDMRLSGIAVWNIEYRRLGDAGGGYPGTFLDIAAGIDDVRQLAATYPLDLTHAIAVGHSAGGHLALWAAARGKLPPASPLYRKNPLKLQVVISLAGIGDLAAFRARGPACGPMTIDHLVDAKNRRDPYADTSPAGMLPFGIPQVIVSGDSDTIVPTSFGDHYAAIAKAKGDQVETVNLKETGHMDMIDPAAPAWPQIKQRILAALRPQ